MLASYTEIQGRLEIQPSTPKGQVFCSSCAQYPTGQHSGCIPFENGFTASWPCSPRPDRRQDRGVGELSGGRVRFRKGKLPFDPALRENAKLLDL